MRDENPLEIPISVRGEAISGEEIPCKIDIPKPFCLVIFGASGDLAKRKIIPSLYRLYSHGLLPVHFSVVGAARSAMDADGFRREMLEAATAAFPDDFSEEAWKGFSEKLSYAVVDYADSAAYGTLANLISRAEAVHRAEGNRIFYLAIPPTVFDAVIGHLGASGLARNTRVVIEKPFGRDLESARRLSAVLRGSFDEEKIYRMDHYLAKETVQSILMFRFANSIFEPLWNRRYIDHVEITVAETLGVEQRAGYYEQAGILRDMFQNHLLHLLALTAMEPPAVFEAERVRDERVKVFRSIRPIPLEKVDEYVVLGQYGEGTVDGREAIAYRDEPEVSPDSVTPTYAAMKLFIDNWRWSGVPFYLRSGKRLSTRKAEISVHFKAVPHMMFADAIREPIEPNVTVLRLQPDEGINLSFQTKNPGSRVCLRPVTMDFSYQKGISLNDYERVLLDCMEGDQMLFVRQDSIEQAWLLLTPLIEKLESRAERRDIPGYVSGSSGPEEAVRFIERDGRKWRPL